MKKNYFFMLSAFLATSVVAQDNGDTLTFESTVIPTSGFLNGSTGSAPFSIGMWTLDNYYDSQWDYWTGFAISNVQDNTTPGYSNQYASYTNGGSNSSNYGVGYGSTTIDLNGPHAIVSLDIANTTYTALSMRDGDAYGKQFGSPNNAQGQPDGTNGEDWFLLSIVKLDANDTPVDDTIKHYLADYRFSDNNLDFIQDSWVTISFSDSNSLSSCYKLNFSLTSSDTNSFGMNTPAYFALDNLVAQSTAAVEQYQIEKPQLFPNPAHDVLTINWNQAASITIRDAQGKAVITAVHQGISSIPVNELSPGIYLVEIMNGNHRFVRQISKL